MRIEQFVSGNMALRLKGVKSGTDAETSCASIRGMFVGFRIYGTCKMR